MKKIIIFLIAFFAFVSVAYADPLYCYIEKNSEDNMTLKNGEEVTVYFKSSHEYGIMNGKYQLYFDPYVFEVVKEEENFVFQDGETKIINAAKHSSIVEFEIDNDANYENELPKIYIKLKVKEDAKKGSSTVELIGDNSYVRKAQTVTDENGEEKLDITEEKCYNSILKYNIDKDNEEKVNDSSLSSIEFDSSLGYLYPPFAPDTYDYKLYLFDPVEDLYLTTLCAVNGCAEEDFKVGEVKKSKKVTITTKNNGSTTKYNVEAEVLDYDYDESYPTLTKLEVRKYTLAENFDEYRSTYHVVVPEDETSLLIDYESDYDVKIEGNENFDFGENVVIITVSKDKTINKYYIVVQKQHKEIIEDDTDPVVPSKDKEQPTTGDNRIANITLGVIILITLIVLTVFIFGSKRKKE